MIQVLSRLFSDQNQMYMATGMAAVMIYAVGIGVVINGTPGLLFLGMVVFSPVAMGLLRWIYEDWFDRSFFNPHVMSFGFVIGDTLLLPTALVMAGWGWQDLPATGWHRSVWFVLACAAIGVLAATVFRYVIDGPRYAEACVASALLSPTKVWHDWAVMPVVVAGFTWLLVPLWAMGGSSFTRPALVFLALFGAALIIDAIVKPDPTRQHPRWDPVRFDVA